MQLSFSWTEPDIVPSDAVVFVRHQRARRYILRVLPDGTVRVTLPRWGAKREARAFVEASRDWIARQRRQPRMASIAHLWGDGARFLLDGREATVNVDRVSNRLNVCCGGAVVATLSSVRRDLREVVESWLRDRARRELPATLRTLAAAHDVSVSRVSIRNQRSRWGACSPTGTITLNWRLIQTPPFVREYVLLHELMHRREPNHSRRFWRLVAACCPRHAEARHWLNTEGKALWPDYESSLSS